MKLDKGKVIAILLEEAKKDPAVLVKVVELLPTLIAVYERIVAEAGKSESPKAPPPSTGGGEPAPVAPESWLENAFHSWYQDSPEASDMTTPEEVEALVSNSASVPPGAVLWLMSNSPDALWVFEVDGQLMTFKQKGELKTWTGQGQRWFVGARYKEQPDGVKDARHILLHLLAVEGPHTLNFWVVDPSQQVSPATKLSLAGKKR